MQTRHAAAWDLHLRLFLPSLARCNVHNRDFAMTGERKIDLSKVWAHAPSADLEETLRARAPRHASAPLVSVGTVKGHVITIAAGAGVDLASLLASKPSSRGDAP